MKPPSAINISQLFASQYLVKDILCIFIMCGALSLFWTDKRCFKRVIGDKNNFKINNRFDSILHDLKQKIFWKVTF